MPSAMWVQGRAVGGTTACRGCRRESPAYASQRRQQAYWDGVARLRAQSKCITTPVMCAHVPNKPPAQPPAPPRCTPIAAQLHQARALLARGPCRSHSRPPGAPNCTAASAAATSGSSARYGAASTCSRCTASAPWSSSIERYESSPRMYSYARLLDSFCPSLMLVMPRGGAASGAHTPVAMANQGYCRELFFVCKYKDCEQMTEGLLEMWWNTRYYIYLLSQNAPRLVEQGASCC